MLLLKDYLKTLEILELSMQVHQQRMYGKSYAMSKYSMEQLEHNNSAVRFTTFTDIARNTC